ncbi:MAG: hypothetical protein CMJ91_01275 [Planctomycetes bacterium]|nr:hypothetical protein [Planctomycetota bacterium]
MELEKKMKSMKNVAFAGLVFMAGLGGYFLLNWSGIGEEVREHRIRIEKVEEEGQEHQVRIIGNQKDIEFLKKEMVQAKERLTEVQGQMKETRERLGTAEAALKKVVESAGRNEEKIGALSRLVEKISREQENLSGELKRRTLKVQALDERLKSQERVNLDIDRRLRVLEDKAGLKPPIP